MYEEKETAAHISFKSIFYLPVECFSRTLNMYIGYYMKKQFSKAIFSVERPMKSRREDILDDDRSMRAAT